MDNLRVALKKLTKSKEFGQLTTLSRFLIIGIKIYETFAGRIDNDNTTLKNTIFMYDEYLTLSKIDEAKKELITAGMIKIEKQGTKEEHIQDILRQSNREEKINITPKNPDKPVPDIIRVILSYKFIKKKYGDGIKDLKKEDIDLTKEEIVLLSKPASQMLGLCGKDVEKVKQKIIERVNYYTKEKLTYNLNTIVKFVADNK